MITACHSCEFNGKGIQLEALIPAGTTDKSALAAKAALARYFAGRCVNCKRVQQDDIRIEKAPKNERPDLTADRYHAHEEPRQCTKLPEDVEQTLKNIIYKLRDIDPLDLLLIIHVGKGGTAGSFGRYINKIIDEAHLYGPIIGRATAKAKWKAVCKKIEPVAALRTWAKGHGGRIAEEPDEDESVLTQSELDL